jgi:hypothetical protein
MIPDNTNIQSVDLGKGSRKRPSLLFIFVGVKKTTNKITVSLHADLKTISCKIG